MYLRVDLLNQIPPVLCVEALCMGEARANVALLQASQAVVRKLMFGKENRLSGLRRDGDRMCIVGKWSP